MSSRPTILVTEHLSEEAVAWLGLRSSVIRKSSDDPGFDTSLAAAHGLIVRTYTTVSGAMLDQAPRLGVVGRAGAGLDNIDVAACRARGVEVVYTPDANTQAVVEFVIALMCDALRPRITLDLPVDAATWNRLRTEIIGRRELSELTLGILGMGRVGQRLAQSAKPLMNRIVYNDLIEIPPERRHGAEPATVEELFSSADVLSVHIDGRAVNRRFISERLLSRMKEDVVFINTSRGFVVDAASLAEFLRNHPTATAMLDVHDSEPFGLDYPMLGLPNARLYPHLASRTMRAMANMSWVVRDVVAVLEGRTPRFPAP